EPEYRIKVQQIHDAFERFRANGPVHCIVQQVDGVQGSLQEWDSYFWVDVTGHEEDRERSQQIKSSSVSELVRLFDKWVVAPKSFEEDVRDELTSAASVYLKLYVQRVQRIAAGDFMGSLMLSSDAEIIEGLMLYDEAELGPEDRIKRIQQFFQSDYYAEMPIERISSELFAMLRQHVRAGQHAN